MYYNIENRSLFRLWSLDNMIILYYYGHYFFPTAATRRFAFIIVTL